MAADQFVKSRVVLRAGAAALVLSGVVLACGGTKPAPKSAADTAPKAAAAAPGVHENIVPHFCASRMKLAQLLGATSTPAPAPAESEVAASAPPPTSVAANTKVAANQAYREVAPGTVLIRSQGGMGTGVVIDPKGYVLTNYHVVADGEKEDFIIHVNVTFGDLTATGRMVREEKTYQAVVVKADPVRDMAIIRVIDPPAKLTTVKLAKSAPQIAEKVISIGHAGIGFLWAAKSCSIASIGERQQDASMLASLDCSHTDPTQSTDEAAREKKQCDERKKMMTDALLAQTQGLAVQTDCAITHGDSGGPLVNAAGELVGLNQSISADLATASFHVHLDEIRDFIAKYGDAGVPIVPDPLCDGGFNPTLEDIDLDGIPDTLVTKGNASVLGGYDRMGILIDLDQDHYKKRKDPNAPFDAEIALLIIRETAYIWYDVDGDSRFDVLLVDKDNDGIPELGYKIDAEGRLTADKEGLPKHDLSAKLVTDTTLHARLGKIASAMGGARYTSRKLVAASKSIALPDALLGAGTQGRALDTDRDGKSDVAFVRGAFSRGLLIDADENSLGGVKPGDSVDDLVKAKKVDAEISIIVQNNTVWAIYDTDNDSKFDLALMTTSGMDESSLFATNAWRLGAGSEMTPAPEQIGRKLLRPALVPLPRATAVLRAAGYDYAEDEAMGSLPDPIASKGNFQIRDVKGFPKGTVVGAQGGKSSTILIDLDHDSKMAATADVSKVVKDGKFDAEIAVVYRGDSEWVFYDTDSDGKFDLVLFVPEVNKDVVAAAYRFGKGATSLELDPKSAFGKPLRTASVFKNKATASKWKTLAAQLFNAASIEP